MILMRRFGIRLIAILALVSGMAFSASGRQAWGADVEARAQRAAQIMRGMGLVPDAGGGIYRYSDSILVVYQDRAFEEPCPEIHCVYIKCTVYFWKTEARARSLYDSAASNRTRDLWVIEDISAGSLKAFCSTWKAGDGPNGTSAGLCGTMMFTVTMVNSNGNNAEGKFPSSKEQADFDKSIASRWNEKLRSVASTLCAELAKGLCSATLPPPPPPPPPPAGEDAYATIIAIDGVVSAKTGPGGWQECPVGRKVGAGDELSTGPESSATLQFLDGSTFVIKDMTILMIGSLLVRADRYKIELLIRLGEAKATVQHRETVRSDWSIRTPTVVSSVRGTVFSVRHDAITESTTVSVEEGEVLVTPNNTTLSPVTLAAGQKLRVTQNGMEKLTPSETGKASVKSPRDQPPRTGQPPAPAAADIVLPDAAAAIGLRDGRFVATIVQKGSTYEEQGLVVGSRLVSIDMTPIAGRTPEEIKKLMKPADSEIVVFEFTRPDGQSIHVLIRVRKQAI